MSEKRTISKLLIAGALMSAATVSLAQELSLYLLGEKDEVLTLVRRGAVEAIPDGSFQEAREGTGVVRSYSSLFFGPGRVAVYIRPVSKKGTLEVVGYSLDFSGSGKTSKGQAQDILKKIQELSSKTAVKAVVERGELILLQQASGDCFEQLKNDPSLSLIGAKLGLSSPNVSVIQLADEARPTPEEKQVIALWAAKRDDCFNARRLAASFYPADLRESTVAAGFEALGAQILSLYKGDISYGEFNRNRRNLSAAYQQQLNQTSVSISREAEEKEAARKAQEQQFAIEKAKALAEQQKANALTQQAEALRRQAETQQRETMIPKTIRIESSPTTCRTVAIGSTLQTNCN